jgi:hypothetical protein
MQDAAATPAAQDLPGVLFTFCDIAPEEEAKFTEWYNREHMRDRILGLPGFRRGRRFVALRGSPKYLAFYEAHNDAVFRSERYLALIKTPDPNSSHFIMRFQNTIRTIGHMTASVGEGEGSMLLVLPLTPQAGREQDLRQALVTDVMPRLLAAPGMMAARLIERDVKAQAPSRTGHVRQGDRTLDWGLLVEAGEAGDLDRVARSLLDPAALERLGAQPPAAPLLYRLLYRVSP